MNAQPEQNSGDDSNVESPKKSSFTSMIVWMVIAVVGIAAGFATPMFLMGDGKPETDKKEELQSQKLAIPDPDDDIGFVEFDEQVVNFNDPRFSRYLKISFSLQVAKSQVESVKALVDEKNDLLVNWLIGHIADKRVEDLRGKQGTNRLRREIHDSFNQILFTDGIERIQDVLYKELNVQ